MVKKCNGELLKVCILTQVLVGVLGSCGAGYGGGRRGAEIERREKEVGSMENTLWEAFAVFFIKKKRDLAV